MYGEGHKYHSRCGTSNCVDWWTRAKTCNVQYIIWNIHKVNGISYTGKMASLYWFTSPGYLNLSIMGVKKCYLYAPCSTWSSIQGKLIIRSSLLTATTIYWLDEEWIKQVLKSLKMQLVYSDGIIILENIKVWQIKTSFLMLCVGMCVGGHLCKHLYIWHRYTTQTK